LLELLAARVIVVAMGALAVIAVELYVIPWLDILSAVRAYVTQLHCQNGFA